MHWTCFIYCYMGSNLDNKEYLLLPILGLLFPNKIVHTTTFVIPDVDHKLEQEIEK